MASDTAEEARETDTAGGPEVAPEASRVPEEASAGVPEPTLGPSGGASGADAASSEAEPAAGEAPPAEPPPTGLDAAALDTLFRVARTQNAWRSEPVSDATLAELFELLKWGPTSANCSPGRFLFLRSREAKERLRPALSVGNIAKTMQAPVTVIIAYDPKFFDLLPRLWPHDQSARSWFVGNEAFAVETAFRNGSLQGAYLIMAARALGLDCGPMSGFNRAKVDEEFFAYRGWKSNFLCNLGYGDPTGLSPRSPRLDFDDACELL